MIKHKWHDLICLFSAGKVVEMTWGNQVCWADVKCLAEFDSDLVNTAFRLKPEPDTEEFFTMYKGGEPGGNYPTLEKALRGMSTQYKVRYILKVTFSGETKLPIKSEIVFKETK